MDTGKFLEDGFCLITEGISKEMLNRLRTIANEIENEALELHHKGSALQGACVTNDSVGPRVMRFDDLHLKYTDDLLNLLATPSLLKLIKEYSGVTSVVLQTDILYKHQHPHPVVKWHQDAPHSRNYPYLNVGIYLDDANLNDGCLSFVPKTQFKTQDLFELETKYGWNPPGVVQQPAKAGDILIHDAMILHSSAPKRSEGVRRTIYVEVRPIEAVLEDAHQDEKWALLRKQWMKEILKRDVTGVFTENEKAYFESEEIEIEDLMQQISEHRCAPLPSAYNFKEVSGPDYPVPADLQIS
tara:strand:+ start:4413 stop:5309 length:897 start_codon:yes stop_codon:yes gene_type:complete